jgi:hypothetical protein
VCLAEAARRVGLPYDRARYRYQTALGVLRRRLTSKLRVRRSS